MSLSIQERLKDLRVERGLTLGQLAEQTGLSKSALGSYETEDFKDISHYALIRLAKFYGVTADYLLGLSEMKNHPNADLADLRLSDEMIDLLKSGRIDNTLLCELAAHPDFPRLMADLEIYVNGTALKQAQGANAIVDTMSSLGIIRILFRQNGARADALTILHHISQVAAARHIHCPEHCHAFQRDVIRHGVGNGGFGFVRSVEDRVNLDTEIPKHHNQQRRKQGKKNFYECFGLALILFMHWVSPLWFYGNTAQFPSYGLSTAPAAAALRIMWYCLTFYI